jgi:hypothetical protein
MDVLVYRFVMSGYGTLCREVAELHGNAEVVLVLSNGRLAASHMKQGGPSPEEGEFRKMLAQLETVIATIKANEDKFGELQSVVIHYRYVDGIFFPINGADTLVIGIMPPYDGNQFISQVSALVEKKKGAEMHHPV